VVHAIGMDPNVDNKGIASVFGVSLQPQGFIGKANAYATFGETSRSGVFVAGSATGPETIDDSIAQAKAAAIAAYALVNGARAAVQAA
ncbi:MAG: pyridine nucleotide-disulfide oxidoreductase, partial [Betaproteobacteria bacterium]